MGGNIFTGHIALENWDLFLWLRRKAVWFSLCNELDVRPGLLLNGRIQDDLPA